MKKRGLLLLALCAGNALAATPRTAVLDVRNMTCPACGIAISKALDKVPGVTGTQVNARAATVTVRFDAERTDPAMLARAVTDAGFPATTRPHGD